MKRKIGNPEDRKTPVLLETARTTTARTLDARAQSHYPPYVRPASDRAPKLGLRHPRRQEDPAMVVGPCRERERDAKRWKQ